MIGREFDYDVLEAVAPLDDDALVAALDEGVDARVLRETGPVGRYAFTHALVRATLYDGLSRLRRARLHGRVGEAIARLRGADLDPAAAPARPPLRAGRAGRAARARDRLRARRRPSRRPPAGMGGGRPALPRRAARARAGGARDDPVRAELLLALGDVRGPGRAGGRGAGDVPGRRRHRSRARRRGAARPRRARLRRPVVDARPRRRGARWRCSRRRSRRSATRTARCARGCWRGWRSSSTTRATRSGGWRCPRRPSTLARRLGDPRTLAACLDARHYALWRPETVDERLEVAAELRRVAEQTGDPELELEGAGWTVVDLLELGDVEGADIQIAAASSSPTRCSGRSGCGGRRCCAARARSSSGDFDAAERLADETLEVGRAARPRTPLNAYAQAMFNIRREQGRLAEVEPAVRRLHRALPGARRRGAPRSRCCWSSSGGRTRRAASSRRSPRPGSTPPARRQLADRRHAARRGVRARWATAPRAEPCTSCSSRTRAATWSSAARRPATAPRRGCSASSPPRCARGSWPRATSSSALAMHERMGARPWVARTQLAYAEMLLARRQRGDQARARELLADAIVIADALGMAVVAQRARDSCPPAPPARAARSPTSPDEARDVAVGRPLAARRARRSSRRAGRRSGLPAAPQASPRRALTLVACRRDAVATCSAGT